LAQSANQLANGVEPTRPNEQCDSHKCDPWVAALLGLMVIRPANMPEDNCLNACSSKERQLGDFGAEYVTKRSVILS
jgi:hypothetical protein